MFSLKTERRKGIDIMEYNFNIVGYLKELLPSTNLYTDVIETLGKTISDNNIYVWVDYLLEVSPRCSGDIERLALNHTKELINIMADFDMEMKIDSDFLVKLGSFGYECICDKILEILQDIIDETETEF